MGWIYDDAEKEANFWRIATCIIALLALIGIPVAWYGIADARDNAQRIIDELRRNQNSLERQLAQRGEELEKERATNKATANINLDGFLYEYNRLLVELRKAIDDYDRAKRTPPSDRTGAVTAAKAKLYAASDAFMKFINAWRSVAEKLNDLLDGNAARMDQARRSDNANDVEGAAQILITTFPGLRDQLQTRINILKSAN
jgi:hypothetical protein